ncbi:MAG TPA: peptidylprolyl isomerase [Gemmatimonadaceae bacterium]|nr:peptidylprolyl isomerase [Gemmatimonadaceae bacterium]
MPNPRRWLLPVLAVLTVATVQVVSPAPGFAQAAPRGASTGQVGKPGSPPATLTAAQRRTVLMTPTHPHWRTRAPDTVALEMETSRGTLAIELIRAWAPHGVDRFYNLVRAGFYDDTRFYRVLPFYIAQFGQPANPAVGALWRERKIPRDSVRAPNERGTLTYAQFNPRDRSTTLFINLNDNLSLDSLGFAPIGRVTAGMEFADQIYSGYGEMPSSPAPLGNPRRFYGESNRFLDKEYPKLDRIIAIRVQQDASGVKPDSGATRPDTTKPRADTTVSR